MNHPKPRFRLNLVLLMFFATVLPTLVILVADYRRLTTQIHEANRDLLVSTAKEGSRQLHQWLIEQEASASAFAKSRELCKSWANRSSPRYLDRLKAAMENFDESSKWTNEVRISSPDGAVQFSDAPLAPNQRFVAPEGEVTLADVVGSRKTVVSSVFLADRPTMIISSPLEWDGEVLGILGCRLAVAELKQLLPTEANFTKLDVYVLTRKGALVSTNVDLQERLQQLPIPGGTWPSAGSNMAGFRDALDRERVGAWQAVPGSDLVVFTAMDAENIRDAVALARRTLAAYLVVAFGLGMLFFIRLGYLLKPLRLLSESSELLSQGDFSARVALSGDDEFGQLGQTFNQMAATMETTLATMAQARDQAMAADRAKGRFLAAMTHELRTPLNAIIGYSEMIMGEVQEGVPDTPQLIEDLGVIRTSGTDLLRLISSILDFSRIESGKMQLSPEEFNPADLLRDVAQVVQPLVAANGNTLHLGLREPLGLVNLDPNRLKQMMLNLLGNACKFTTKGDIRLRARLDGEMLELEVEDTGIGMTPEEQERIFHEFAQADESISRRFGGTGLGLTLVQRLVTLMHGTIHVTSEPEKGSTFTVRVPRRQEEKDSPA